VLLYIVVIKEWSDGSLQCLDGMTSKGAMLMFNLESCVP